MTQFAIKNDTLVYRKTGRKVPKPEQYRIKSGRVYKGGRLKGYIGKLPASKLKVPKSQRKNFILKPGNAGFFHKKSGRRASNKKYTWDFAPNSFDKFVVKNEKGEIVGNIDIGNLSSTEAIDTLIFGYVQPQFNDYALPEIDAPSFKPTKPEGFSEVGLDSFFSDYKQVLEVLGPTIGPSGKVLGPGVISVEQRSYVNFANALNSAVEAGYITEAEAAEYFKWYSYANDKQKAQLWDELYDYYEEMGFDYFE